MAQRSAEPRRRGRPATGETPKRYVRIDDDAWAQIRQAADLCEENVSRYIRRVVLKDAARVIRKNEIGRDGS